MSNQAPGLSNRELQELFEMADTDGDGQICYNEFVNSMVAENLYVSW